jgi:hypothetical protein
MVVNHALGWFCCLKTTPKSPSKTGLFLRVYQKVDQNLPICYNSCIVNKKEQKMSKLTAYTLEIYKTDRRIKEGRRLVEKHDYAPVTRDYIDTLVEKLTVPGITIEIHETFVTKKNLMGGREFTERYDTPHFCSPASESYWSM